MLLLRDERLRQQISATALAASEAELADVVGYTLVYGALAVVEVGLMLKYIKLGLPEVEPVQQITDDDDVLSFAY